ncbi:Rrf2 family transcriptional regulator [Actinocorallia longicatena]|uniref:Nitric oxide-sensing transcriptional repressor NsrR n=1 Tax=Actinocorallia longicatena TaxID=111803 RepID=A0ABP6PXH7_9ACTN
MRLTRFTDLALRVAMRLAVLDGTQEQPTARQVAADVAAPFTHVAKVVSRLRHAGVVEARRGRGGGLALAPGAGEISVGWLVRELEGIGDVVGCEEEPACPLRGECRLRGELRKAQEAFYATLDPVTIGDLVEGPQGPVLVRLLVGRPGEA